MNPSCDLPDPRTVRCGLLTHAVVRLSPEEVRERRRTPWQGCGDPLSISSLKHIGDQTLAVLTAICRAIDLAGLELTPGSTVFRDWGVIAAPRFLGRAPFRPALARFHVEGAWGVSPHLVPHQSLHAVSGTVSQFLKIQGPNFGVGGGPGGEAEALLAGAALLESLRLPGLWLLFSRIEPELPPTESGQPHPDASCQAIALALVPSRTPHAATHLEFVAGLSEENQEPSLDFTVLADVLTTRLPVERSLGRTGRLRLHRQPAFCPGGQLSFTSSALERRDCL